MAVAKGPQPTGDAEPPAVATVTDAPADPQVDAPADPQVDAPAGRRQQSAEPPAVATLTAPPSVPQKSRSRIIGDAMLVALPAWVVARVLVLASLGIAHLSVASLRPDNPAAQSRVHQGLLAWDAGWYESIARHGYAATGVQALRFFPAYPMAARVVGGIPGVGVPVALVVLANASALVAMSALVVLVERDLGDRDLARRSAWLLGLAPSAYALVLGYADAALLACAVVAVLGARTGRWWWAALAGAVGGLVRPVGILLVVPLLIEAWQDRQAPKRPGGRVARWVAVTAPVAGTAAYLLWVRQQFGDLWLPFSVQQQHGHRGGVSFPVAAMWRNLVAVAHGHHLGSASHIPWVILCVVLVVIAFRRLPWSYAALAGGMVVVSAASTNLDSFERYALGAFPLVVAASTLTGRRRVEAVVLVLSAAAMTGYALLAFLGIVVP